MIVCQHGSLESIPFREHQPLFLGAYVPDLYLSKLMHSNDPQPLPFGRIARYPTLPNLNRPLSAKSNRRRQWAEDQLLPVVQHVKHDRGHVKHVASKQMLLNYRKEHIQYVGVQGSCNRIVFSQDMLDDFAKRNGNFAVDLGSHST